MSVFVGNLYPFLKLYIFRLFYFFSVLQHPFKSEKKSVFDQSDDFQSYIENKRGAYEFTLIYVGAWQKKKNVTDQH